MQEEVRPSCDVIVLAECCSKGYQQGKLLAEQWYRTGRYPHVPVQVRHLHGRELVELGICTMIELTKADIQAEPHVVLIQSDQDGTKAKWAPASQWSSLCPV